MRLTYLGLVPLVAVACGGPIDESEDVAYAEQSAASSCASICTDKSMIIGCDDRLRGATTKSQALSQPYRSIGSFTSGCTGALISDRHVLTAAHCFQGTPKASKFALGRYATWPTEYDKHPYGKVPVKRVYIPAQYSPNSGSPSNKALDIAVAELDAPIPNAYPMKYGHLGWLTLQNKTVRTIGYPGDKADGSVWKHTSGSFIVDADQWIDGGDRGVLHSDTDGTGGQSGSPTYVFHNGKRRVVGVLVGSPEHECQAGRIWSSRITPNIKTRIDRVVGPGWDLWWDWVDLPSSTYEPPDV